MTVDQNGWETIDIPRGTYYGWSSNPASAGRQRIIGEVMAFSMDRGERLNNKGSCPELSLITTAETISFNKNEEWKKIPANELVNLTCSLANLEAGVVAARLKPGDTVMITLTGFTQVDKGTAKQFDIKVKRGNGQVQNNAARTQQAPPPPAADPWGAAPPAQQQFNQPAAQQAPPPQQTYAAPPQQAPPPPPPPAQDPWGSAPAGVGAAPAGAAWPANDEPPF